MNGIKRIKNWIDMQVKGHLIRTWIVGSVIFAFSIHCLFSIAAPNDWLRAKWSAGDILTFVSTIALGLLAIWQNLKFKEENDLTQGRMEELTKRANEISMVNKIIEYESERLTRLRTNNQNFIDSCNTEAMLVDLSDIAHQPSDFMRTYVKIQMNSREKRIRLSGLELMGTLQIYEADMEIIHLIESLSEYSKASLELIEAVRTNELIEEKGAKKSELEKKYINCASALILKKERLINRLLFENLSMDQIRTMYNNMDDEQDGKTVVK